MSVRIRTAECYPEAMAARLPWVGEVAEPRHSDCPGGFHVPGVIGGWDCQCPCHHNSTAAQP